MFEKQIKIRLVSNYNIRCVDFCETMCRRVLRQSDDGKVTNDCMKLLPGHRISGCTNLYFCELFLRH